MQRKHRIILILIVGTLVGGLVIAASLSGGEDHQCADKSVLHRLRWKWNHLLVKLGPRPKPHCVPGLKEIDAATAIWAMGEQASKTNILNASNLDGDKACPP